MSSLLNFGLYLDPQNHARYIRHLTAQAHHEIPNESVFSHLQGQLQFFGRNGYFRYDASLALWPEIQRYLPKSAVVDGRPRPLDFSRPADALIALGRACDELCLRLKELVRYWRIRRRQNPRQFSRDHEEAFLALCAVPDPAQISRRIMAALLEVQQGATTPLAAEAAARDLFFFGLQFSTGFRTELYCALQAGLHVRAPASYGPVQFDLTPDLFKNHYNLLLKYGVQFTLPEALTPGGVNLNRLAYDYVTIWHPRACARLPAARQDWLFLPLLSRADDDGSHGLRPSTLQMRSKVLSALVAPELAPIGYSPSLLRTLCAGTLAMHGHLDAMRYLLADAPRTFRRAYLTHFLGRLHARALADYQQLLLSPAACAAAAPFAAPPPPGLFVHKQ